MNKLNKNGSIENSFDDSQESFRDEAHIALSGSFQIEGSNATTIYKDNAKIIAFYLPQFHEVPENSLWWGEGFTEWTNVRKALPNFDGHSQPRVPAGLGYYDLSSCDVMYEQAKLAKTYGVQAFCFYYYWFSGRKILEKPIENFLKSDVDIEFCLCWANENWTRTWDGDNKSILLEQKYLEGEEDEFIYSLLPFFKDRRYILVNGCPLLIVYRAMSIPNSKKIFQRWRTLVQKEGFKGLHITVVDFYDISTPGKVGADAILEFPPHKFNGSNSHPDVLPSNINENFKGGLLDYDKVIAISANKPKPSFMYYRGLIPSWDNSARRQNSSTIVINESPNKFGLWLSYIRAYTRESLQPNNNLIFINAWNEWGEGCYLEPDERWGLKFLEEIENSSFYKRDSKSAKELSEELLKKIVKLRSENLGKEKDSLLDKDDLIEFKKLKRQKKQNVQIHKISIYLSKYATIYKVVRFIYRKTLK
jgi:hypothetical protein